jgi:hypothetical protein
MKGILRFVCSTVEKVRYTSIVPERRPIRKLSFAEL